MSQHDLLNKYFKRDAVLLRNIDFFRFGYLILIASWLFALTLWVHEQSLRSDAVPRHRVRDRANPAAGDGAEGRHSVALRARVCVVFLPLLRTRAPAARAEREQVYCPTLPQELPLSAE